MNKIGFIGIGKLGLPVSVCIALKGHRVFAYDADVEKITKYIRGNSNTGSYEPNLKEQLRMTLSSGNLSFLDSIGYMWAKFPEIIFVAVPTPSKDDNSFDTSYVKQALTTIEEMPKKEGYNPVIVIISTVLPMTMRTEFAPLIGYPIVYNPFFIAMGTVCVKPEQILLGCTPIAISEMRVNDSVLTQSGMGKVLQTFEREFDGDLIKIKPRGCFPIEVTPEHPLLIASRNDYYNKSLDKPKWVSAKDIIVGEHNSKRNDYLIIPRIKGHIDATFISLTPFATEHGIKIAKGWGCSDKFPLTEDTCWLLGLFVAEGSTTIGKKAKNCSLQFGLHIKEIDYMEKIQKTLKNLNYSSHVSKKENGMKVGCGSAILSRAFREWCGHLAQNKKIPEFILYHKKTDLLRAFLDGYEAGDGSKRERYTGSIQTTNVTVSRELTLQLQIAYARLGIFAYVSERKNYEPRRIYKNKHKSNMRQAYSIRYESSRRKSHVYDDYIAVKIHKIERIPYKGKVCNIETPDNTYLISNLVVHNCEDYLAPEFVLLGYDTPKNNEAMKTMVDFYTSIYRDEPKQPPLLHMTWENAEACKMLYNTIIGAKIVIANTVMEMCHNIPYTDCDVIVDAFEYATKRIVGSKYLRGGLGDGGECHPRDNRALGYLSDKLGVSTNIFKFIMESREAQTRWLVDLIVGEKLSAVILGKRFKANSNLTTDSCSIMVYDALEWMGVDVHYHDPMLNLEYYPSEPHVFLVAINEPWTRNYPYPSGSVVLDVWRQFDEADVEMLTVRGVKYVPIGRNQPCL